MPAHLSLDTQAILLLCGKLGQLQESDVSPLTPSEYDRLAQWLHRQEMRPGDLLAVDWCRGATDGGLPVPIARVQSLLQREVAMARAVESWTNNGLWVVSRGDEAYPRRLKSQLGGQAPPILYGAGPIALASRGGLAIVGSRHAEEIALTFARCVAQTCAYEGIQIVSGGARGVDTAAASATLASRGTAVVVVAQSLARQAASQSYRQALLDGQLALLSAYDPASSFSVGHAMGRNRYIYALADYALVVSARMARGGTWAGAVQALRAGQTPVFVWAQEQAPTANRALLEKGAKPFPDEPWTSLAAMLARPD
jgi:predicted Rossmann fold nucleotide-binding protein DprA/Smf involved in DNA uptake